MAMVNTKPRANAVPKIAAGPKEEGLMDKSTTELMEKAIDSFHPDKNFTRSCLVRMKFRDKAMTGREKLALLAIVKLYSPEFQQLTLVDYIGYVNNRPSDETDLQAMLANMKSTRVMDNLAVYRRAEDADLRRMIAPKVKKPDRFSDDDY